MAEFLQLFLAPGSNSRSEHVNGNWLRFKEELTTAIKKHIPTQLSKSKRDLPRITNEIRLKLRWKECRYRKARHIIEGRLTVLPTANSNSIPRSY